MDPEIHQYHTSLESADQEICDLLFREITLQLPAAEAKVWHAHPVWFLDGNPVVGYSKLKSGIRLLFWSGQSFEEEGLTPEGKFKAAEVRFRERKEVKVTHLRRWLKKAATIQWDYKNIVKRKGVLLRLK